MGKNALCLPGIWLWEIRITVRAMIPMRGLLAVWAYSVSQGEDVVSL